MNQNEWQMVQNEQIKHHLIYKSNSGFTSCYLTLLTLNKLNQIPFFVSY